MADLLRPDDEGIVGGGIGPDGRPDPRVAILPPQSAAPEGIVMVPGQQHGWGGGEDRLSSFPDELSLFVGSAAGSSSGLLYERRPERPRPRHPTVERLREHFRVKPKPDDKKPPPVFTPRMGATAKATLLRSVAWTRTLENLFLDQNINPTQEAEDQLKSCKLLLSDFIKQATDFRLSTIETQITSQAQSVKDMQQRGASPEVQSDLRRRLDGLRNRWLDLKRRRDELVAAAREAEGPADTR